MQALKAIPRLNHYIKVSLNGIVAKETPR